MLVGSPHKLIALDAVPPKVEQTYTKAELLQKVYQYAEIYNVDPHEMIKIINCEDVAWDTHLKSELHYKEGNRWGFPAGTQEKSYGLVQIHLPDHKDISLEQAYDPDFSIRFLAQNLARAQGSMWTCYKK